MLQSNKEQKKMYLVGEVSIGDVVGRGNVRQGYVWSGEISVGEISVREVTVGDVCGWGNVSREIVRRDCVWSGKYT